MKKQMKKLNRVLKMEGYSPRVRSFLKVYLSIVLFHKKIPEVAKYFGLPELKVQSALTICGVRLQKDKFFAFKMRAVTKALLAKNQLRILS
jgi:hypothetical protein